MTTNANIYPLRAYYLLSPTPIKSSSFSFKKEYKPPQYCPLLACWRGRFFCSGCIWEFSPLCTVVAGNQVAIVVLLGSYQMSQIEIK